MSTDSKKGKTCKYCGHVIYYSKSLGWRCMCDRAEPASSAESLTSRSMRRQIRLNRAVRTHAKNTRTGRTGVRYY
jgi:hypothetical protein